MGVEDCAIRTNADSKAGGPCVGGDKHFVFSNHDGARKCSCCTVDPTNPANVLDSNLDVERIYRAAGSPGFEPACAVKKVLKGAVRATMLTTEGRGLKCEALTWEFQATTYTAWERTANANTYITSVQQFATNSGLAEPYWESLGTVKLRKLGNCMYKDWSDPKRSHDYTQVFDLPSQQACTDKCEELRGACILVSYSPGQ